MSRIRGVALTGDWKPEEAQLLEAALAQLPDRWLKHNRALGGFARQPKLLGAPASAPGHSKYEHASGRIVIYDKGIYSKGKIDQVQFRRSVYHELAHTLLRANPETLDRFSRQTKTDGFVDEYAKTSPEEDFADTFSEVLLYPERAAQAVPQKAAFITRLLDRARGETKEAMDKFIAAFSDEIEKTAGPVPMGLLSRLSSKIPKAPIMKGLAVGGLGGGAYLAGSHKGEEKGMSQGTAGLEQGMQQAYVAGVQRGAHAMLERIQQQMSGGQK